MRVIKEDVEKTTASTETLIQWDVYSCGRGTLCLALKEDLKCADPVHSCALKLSPFLEKLCVMRHLVSESSVGTNGFRLDPNNHVKSNSEEKPLDHQS